MAHYSEMNFLFGDTNKNLVTDKIQEYSIGNTFNVLKDKNLVGRPGYTVFKNKGNNTGTIGIKNYLRENIYEKEQKGNPYIKLLDEFNEVEGNPGAGLRLKPSDFAYLKDLGVYPINRMAILRRFPEGCFVPEDLNMMTTEPISTIVGWIKPDQNFGTISFNESWSTMTERFDVALANILKKATGGIDISSIVPVPDFAQGMLFEFYKNMELLNRSGSEDSVDETYEYYDTGLGDQDKKKNNSVEDKTNTWGLNNIPIGDPNVLQEAPFRDPEGQNIRSEYTFELETVYEQKLLGDVDPGSAMLDILDNIYAMGTSNMVFYWGDDSPTIKDAKATARGKSNSIEAWWEFIKNLAVKFWETLTGFLKKAVQEVKDEANALISSGKSEDQKTQQNNQSREKDLATQREISASAQKRMNDINRAYPNDGKNSTGYKQAQQQKIDADKKIQELEGNGISNPLSANSAEGETKMRLADAAGKIVDNLISLLQTILTSTIAIHRFRLRGSIELMVGGQDSTAPWHLTLGNPFSPWINTSHIIVKSAQVETSSELGFNDMPQRLTAKFTCAFSRSLGKQELMRMFNNSYRRTYSKPRNLASNSITPNTLADTKNQNTINTSTTPDTTVVPSDQKTPGASSNNSNDPSIVNYLQSKGQDYSYSARKKMANEMGIKNYRGTAEQNTFILNTLRSKNS